MGIRFKLSKFKHKGSFLCAFEWKKQITHKVDVTKLALHFSPWGLQDNETVCLRRPEGNKLYCKDIIHILINQISGKHFICFHFQFRLLAPIKWKPWVIIVGADHIIYTNIYRNFKRYCKVLVSFYYQITFNRTGRIHVKINCMIKRDSKCHGSFRIKILIYLVGLTVLESRGFSV